MNSPYGSTRTLVRPTHALIAPDGHVSSPLSGWQDASGVVLISPVMQPGPRFVQYLVHGSRDARSVGAAAGVQRLVYVLEGEAQLDGQALAADAFAWLPPDEPHDLRPPEGTTLLVFEKRYQPLPAEAAPGRVVGTLAKAPSEAFLGDPDAVLSTLLPITPGFDMAVNVFTYQPGATLPFVETHVMEHGLYMKSGQGVYRLADEWMPVAKGDAIWMASYCTQWFVAMGKRPAAYIYYKDIHRDPLSTGDFVAPSEPA
ncbi:hypothetical protein Pla123a_28970 [Posidoniimonas polymericola]|uniref:Cupin type-2 domain-containing protein n=1 Tax=Posidoniimonas polymericola TaxID=2528002 RepID=A0A5C5YMU4_9BACT|nr:(S)-ureidoglycine aminohydrolase [Posidoniimonas polymericola]TWT76108.1 hypothetical protein Pla123a_28970 [Posidoniimonas polymericola]